MARKQYPSDCGYRFMLRLPDGMHPRLVERAKRNHRSMNGEIIVILATALGDQSATTAGHAGKLAPAVVSEQAALQGGALSTKAMEQPR